jgi:hypothetical protein
MMGGALSSGNVPIDTIEHDTERLFAAVDDCRGISLGIRTVLYGQDAICEVETKPDREPCLENKIKEIITIAEEVRETLMSIRERL